MSREWIDIPGMSETSFEAESVLIHQIQNLFERTKKQQWKKASFANLLRDLDIPGLTPQLAQRLAGEIKSHLKKNDPSPRAKEHLIELIEERLNAWGLLKTDSSKKSAAYIRPPAQDTLSQELLDQLTYFRRQEKLAAFIAPPNSVQSPKTSFPKELYDQWAIMIGLNDDSSPSETFDRLSNILALKERAYRPDAMLAACKDVFLNTFLHPGVFFSPLLLKNLGVSDDISESAVLAPPKTVDDSFETLKQITVYGNKGLPLGIYLGELPPSSDHFESPSLSGEVLPFLQALLNSSRMNAPLRLSLPVSHPDILGFIDLVPQMALQGIRPTVILEPDFTAALFQGSSWSAAYGGKSARSLTLKQITEKLVRSIVECGGPDLLSVKPEARIGSPCYQGGIFLRSKEAPLSAHLNVNDLALNASDFWDHMRELLGQICHLLDNASPPGQGRHFIFNLYGVRDWVEAQGMAVESSRAAEQIERLFSFIRKELIEISGNLAKQRGGSAGQRFAFHVSCFDDATVSVFFSGRPGLPRESFKDPAVPAQWLAALGPQAAPLILSIPNPSPNDTLRAVKLMGTSQPILAQFRPESTRSSN